MFLEILHKNAKSSEISTLCPNALGMGVFFQDQKRLFLQTLTTPISIFTLTKHFVKGDHRSRKHLWRENYWKGKPSLQTKSRVLFPKCFISKWKVNTGLSVSRGKQTGQGLFPELGCALKL